MMYIEKDYSYIELTPFEKVLHTKSARSLTQICIKLGYTLATQSGLQ